MDQRYVANDIMPVVLFWNNISDEKIWDSTVSPFCFNKFQ